MNRTNTPKQWAITAGFLFLVFLPLAVMAQSREKRINLQNKNISFREAFMEIERQTGYSVAYEASKLKAESRLSVWLKEADIDKALTQILKGTGHTYRIKGYHVIISRLPDHGKPAGKKPRALAQTVRGIVTDAATNTPIEYATVKIGKGGSLGATTDSLGRFRIDNVPVGRHDLQTDFVGYHTNIVRSIPVTSTKEIYVEIPLEESIQSLKEVLIRPEVRKDKPLNTMAIGGGRMISMEEAGRFANGFDDPARLSSAFAGVAGDVGTNAVAIRGNAPQFTQWRLEGVEIPNPTHFADLSGLGGGFLSALSTQVIGNSDFYNGAFPAEYGNALSGIFDMHLRNGNNRKHEHTFQLGLMGIDIASEGPISRKRGSSYIFNYRFSTTSLATGNDINLKYQDFAFKLNFPTRRAGTFSLWGIGLIDRNKAEAKERSQWETDGDRQSGKNQLDKAAGGVTHRYVFNETAYLHSSLAATYSNDHQIVDQLTEADNALIRVADIRNSRWDVVLNTYLNKKFSARHTNRTGVILTGLQYDLDYRVSPYIGLDIPMKQVSRGSGESALLSAYSSSVISLNPDWTTSLGVNARYFTLNRNWSVEPRAAVKWQPNVRHALAFAYGLHSRKEKLDYYFIEQEVAGKRESNRYLDFSKAHHIGLTYDWNISPSLHLRIEPYYQYLYHIPVERNTSFSIINHEDFYLERLLVNKGAGRNYGIDITLERYMQGGFYYLLTASFFKSRYKGGDSVWRNTRLDKGFLMNLLAGKEWMVGKLRQNVFSINGRLLFQGGGRYTPIDEERSLEEHDVVFDETRAFSRKFKPSVNGDVSVSYRINKRRVSHEFAVKILNVGMRTGMHFYEYDVRHHRINRKEGMGMIPNISYKIYF